MKKMNKTYEAPVAEVIEMQMPSVLMMSDLNSGSDETVTGNPWG
jgi:hypothetical protein